VQDADEAVGQSAQSLVVGVAGGAVLVVEGACAGAAFQGGERLAVQAVVEPWVTHVAGHDGVFSARCNG
jgi:hypothetical protein